MNLNIISLYFFFSSNYNLTQLETITTNTAFISSSRKKIPIKFYCTHVLFEIFRLAFFNQRRIIIIRFHNTKNEKLTLKFQMLFIITNHRQNKET